MNTSSPSLRQLNWDFFMVNINGKIIDSEKASLSINNRGYNYGDAVFETLKVVNGKINFFEDHYFRLMATMRILRMEIPMTFTLEFIESEILRTVNSNNLSDSSSRVKMVVNRKQGGLYLPEINDVDYIIQVTKLKTSFYELNNNKNIIELYKDYFIAPNLLSTLKTTNRLINIVGSVFAKENNFHNCLLMNTNKQIVEALNANLFLINGNIIKTPPLSDGCINGIMRKQVISILNQMSELTIDEASVSPFELQKADELFLTNTIIGLQPVTHYRKKIYDNSITKDLLGKLNAISRN